MSALVPEQAGDTEDRQIVRLGPAASEHHFARLGLHHDRQALSEFIQQRARTPPYVMNAGGIAPRLIQKRKHGLAHCGIQWRGRVVVQIDGRGQERSRDESSVES